MAPLVWLVTGCSSGFGEEFVHQIIARGDHVIATARNVDKIQSLETTGAKLLQLDVNDDQAKLNAIIKKALEFYGRIDVLVNNAGYVLAGTLEDIESEDIQSIFDTNVFGALRVTKALLPHFRERRSGTMVFVSSLVAWVGHRFTGPYASTKFALEGFVESLSRDVPSGIQTLILEPGRFRTKLLSENNLKAPQSKIPDYAEAIKEHRASLAAEDFQQPGNPKTFVKIAIDLVHREGVAEGRQVPLRMPLGGDSYFEIKGKCEETLALLEEWKDVIHSTDF